MMIPSLVRPEVDLSKALANVPINCIVHATTWHCRRLTGLTNAFSKKLSHFQSAVVLNFGYYNHCKRHISVKTTPAVADRESRMGSCQTCLSLWRINRTT